jgi:hypothetical protein
MQIAAVHHCKEPAMVNNASSSSSESSRLTPAVLAAAARVNQYWAARRQRTLAPDADEPTKDDHPDGAAPRSESGDRTVPVAAAARRPRNTT